MERSGKMARHLSDGLGRLKALSDLDEGRTADAIKSALSQIPMFKSVSDKQWLVLGNELKSLYKHTSVFTGAMAALISYLIDQPKPFPATIGALEAVSLKTERYDTTKVVQILVGDEMLEPVPMTGARLLALGDKIRAMDSDREQWKASPRKTFTVFQLGGDATEVWEAFGKAKIRIGR